LALTINFTGPLAHGFVQVRPSVVAAGKSTAHMAAAVFAENAIGEAAPAPAAVASLVFAKRRASDAVNSLPMPPAPPAASVPRARFANDQVSWPSQYEQHMVLGQPFQPNPQMRTLTWTRYADHAPLSFARLAAMADASLPRIYFHFKTLSPISTVTMTVQFHCDAVELAAVGNDFVLIEAHCHAARHGFFDQHLRIFSTAGQLLATSTQLVWFKSQTQVQTDAPSSGRSA
jgi:hypothetical protein